ncbi:putative leader peptide [Streptomyces winkii]
MRRHPHPLRSRALSPRALHPRRRIRLYSRPHIDLRRVAGALCRP